MAELRIRTMQAADRAEVAELICVSTNVWFQMRGYPAVFPGGPETTAIYFDVYEALDPGQAIVAEDPSTGRIMGSVFLHPRPTHISLGIMNVHPNHFGKRVAGAMLKQATELADSQNKPLRLVSSGRNTDSFSLYNKVGFVPRYLYQGMFLDIPEEGLPFQEAGEEQVREATLADVEAMAALELEVTGIQRENDLRYFVENADGIWSVSVFEDSGGKLDGFMASCSHPGCNMIGPGAARTEEQTKALLLAELRKHPGRSPAFMLPVTAEDVVQTCYRWGAKNYEVALGQVRGDWQPMQGIAMPTFLPETS